MKRKVMLLFCLVLSLLVTACGSAAPSGAAETSSAAAGHKVLVAYFSRSGNTQTLAQEIQRQTGGDIFRIVPQEPYSENYNQTVARFRQERDTDARPAIVGTVANIDSYDVILVGYPNWGSDMPHVVRTFLQQYNLAGKTVIPFCTSGGGGMGNSVQTLRSLCPNANIGSALHVSGRSAGSSAGDVGDWLRQNGVVR